jgi:hypothetical protein
MKPDPDVEPLCFGTDLGVTQERPRTWGILDRVHLIYAYCVPSSIDDSSKVNSGSSSARGGGVDVRGRDGSGRIKSLPTYGLFNLTPARLCVGASLHN